MKAHQVPQGTVDVTEILAYLRQDYYMDKREVSRYLSVSVRTVEGLKDLPRFRVGSKVLFKRSEVDRWMMKHRETDREDLDRVTEAVKEMLRGE
jgi:excisionase family DNA binding protein